MNDPIIAMPDWGCSQDHFYKIDDAVPIPTIERADGIHMWDTHGNRHIDASAGPNCDTQDTRQSVEM